LGLRLEIGSLAVEKIEAQMPSYPGFSPIETPSLKRLGCGRLAAIQYQCVIERPMYSEWIRISIGCDMKQFQKRFIKEVVAEVTILSALIIVPLAFLGPGWTRKPPNDRAVAARFRQEHPVSKAAEQAIERD
jgi:hypothetical protein